MMILFSQINDAIMTTEVRVCIERLEKAYTMDHDNSSTRENTERQLDILFIN